jgi:carbonic anhydrase
VPSEILPGMNALLIGCSDGRIAGRLDALLTEIGHPDANRLLVPGGLLPFTRPGSERRVALSYVREIVDVHDVRQVILVAHQECAAYAKALGGLGFDQRELLERDLRKVKTLLETEISGVDVRCYVLPWHEDGETAAYGPATPVE